jgi:hypothetical protein
MLEARYGLGLYNFQARFEQFVIDGRKRHTIRAERAHPDEPGNICHLYVGLRTRNCRLIFRAPCVRVEPIQILSTGRIILNGATLSDDEAEKLAQGDGFRNFGEFFRFFQVLQGRLPLDGNLIEWSYEKRFR